jgi:cytochrome c peroxidase
VPHRWLISICIAMFLAAHACGVCAQQRTAAAEPYYATRYERRASVEEMTSLGRAIFFDRSISASGKLACANCHDPARAFGPPNGLPVQPGGPAGAQSGQRAVPSLRYLHQVPAFTEHFHESEGDDSIDQGPTGGHTWDGRARNVHEQAAIPLLSPLEMANANPGQVVARVAAAPYAARMRAAFGEHLFDDPAKAFNAITLSLEVFQQSPADFYPYDSKFDAWLRGTAKFTESERRGLLLFNDAAKGNCASCHPSAVRGGAFPAFTDWGFIALGVPRNARIPANRDPAYFDLGLCGPMRTDLADRKDYCGRFRAPSLRNVALRRTFFHNGRVASLEDAVRFYVERDTKPAKWYPRGRDGKPGIFDDLPEAYRENVNREPPFDRKVGDAPALSDAEIRDVVAFLATLTDGYESRAKGIVRR